MSPVLSQRSLEKSPSQKSRLGLNGAKAASTTSLDSKRVLEDISLEEAFQKYMGGLQNEIRELQSQNEAFELQSQQIHHEGEELAKANFPSLLREGEHPQLTTSNSARSLLIDFRRR